jgi:DNA-binding beta-propeller fold protein YncE
MVSAATQVITTVAGTGICSIIDQNLECYNGDNIQATSAMLNQPNGVAVDATGQLIPIAGFPILTGGIGNGISPESLVYDAAGGRLYALNDTSRTVSA